MPWAPLFACQPPPRGRPAPPGAQGPVSGNGTSNCRLFRANYTRTSPPPNPRCWQRALRPTGRGKAPPARRSAPASGRAVRQLRPKLRGEGKAPQGPGTDGSVCRAERGGAGRVRSLSHRRAPIPAAGTRRSGPAPPRSIAAIDPRGGKGRPEGLLGQTPPKGGEKKAPVLIVPHLRRGYGAPGAAAAPRPLRPAVRGSLSRSRPARAKPTAVLAPRGLEGKPLVFASAKQPRGAPPQRERRAGNAARPRPPLRLQRCCRARLGAERGWRFADAAVEACSI